MWKLIPLLALLCATSASAADLTVQVKGADGAPVADAVVTVYPAGGGAGSLPLDAPYVMAQQNIHFDPFVLVVPVGATVSFPNRDKVRHHVYSFSPAHPFELKLYGKDETRTVKFEKVGTVALGCNIHDTMIAFIKVVDTRYAAKTNAAGVLTIHDLPAGAASLHLWRPYMKGINNEQVRAINVPGGGGTESFTVEVHAPAAMKPMY